MIRIFTSAGSFAAAMALAAGPRIALMMIIHMTMMITWMIKAERALLKKVNFVTPQNWRCQEWTRDQKMREDPTAANEKLGLRPRPRLPFQKIYPRMWARIVWPMAVPGCPT